MKIAFIGLGNMGGGMAANLVKAGHDVRAFDLSEDALSRARENGCQTFGAVPEAVDGVDAVVSMLPNGAIVKSVYTADVIGKALLLQRTLLAGQHEPHIESATPARQAVQRQLATLEREIQALQTEMQLRQMLAGNTASLILERQEAATATARAVQQGDPEPGRLREAQSGPSGQP